MAKSNVHYGLRLALGGAPANWHTVLMPDGTPMVGLFHPEIVSPIEELGIDEQTARAYAATGGVVFEEVPRGKLKPSREALQAAMHTGRRSAVREGRRRPGEHDYIASAEFAATAPSAVEVDPTPVITGEADEPIRENEDPAEAEKEGDR